MGMQGIRVGKWGMVLGMLGMQECGNAGNQGENAGNGGGNAGNQGGNLGTGCECGESGCFFVRIFMFIASAKIPEREESISPSSFHGQLPDY